MPLVAHRPLASLERIRAEGHEVLTIDRASNQRIRELHIGLLNMMPDGALEAHGLRLLVADRDGQMAMATSPDGFRQIYFQGHPEYDQLSLWKEFKRDLNLFYAGQLQQAPRLPRNYLSPAGMEIFERFLASDSTDTDALEAALAEEIEITWRDTAKALFANWLGLVYQLTHYDRQRQYMDGVNPADPLGLKNS